MSYVEKIVNIYVDECTTHEVEIILKDFYKKLDSDLEDLQAVFTSIYGDNTIEKLCAIEGNKVLLVLNPTDTAIYCSDDELEDNLFTRPFQVRLFREGGKVYHLAKGFLKICKVHKNYTSNPLVGGQNG